MPAPRKAKPLAVANSISELNWHAENVKINIKGDLQCKQYCKSIADIFKKGEAKFQDGDEENSYILFMRFFHVFDAIKNTYEYQKQKKFYNEIINIKNIMMAMERAETLSKSLQARYEQLESDRKSSNAAKGKEDSSGKHNTQTTNLDAKFRHPETTLQPKTNQNVPKENKPPAEPNGTLFNSLPNVPDLDDEVDGNPPTKITRKVDPWMAPDELYNLLKSDNLSSILIIDTRPLDEFAASRIKSHSISLINVREELLKPGANVNSIERRLPKNVWEVWITRGTKDHVIIMDHDSTRENTGEDSPIQILKDAILNPLSPMKSEPRLLNSGFNGWQLYYPSLCTDPFYKKSKPKAATAMPDPTTSLSSLSYPSLRGINVDNESSGMNGKSTRGVDVSGKVEKNDVANDPRGFTGNQDGDLLAKLRRQLDGPPSNKQKVDPSAIMPNASGNHLGYPKKVEPGGDDMRSRTEPSGANDLRNGNNQEMTNRDTSNRLDSAKANHFELKDIPINDARKDASRNDNIPSQMPGPGAKAGGEGTKFGTDHGPKTDQKPSKDKDDFEIITAKYSRKESGYGSLGSLTNSPVGTNHPHGGIEDFDAQLHALSETGNPEATAGQKRPHFGSLGRDGQPRLNVMFQKDPSGTASSLKDARQSPVKVLPQRPGSVDNPPGSTGPGPGQYATVPRANSQITSLANNPESGQNPAPRRSFSVPQNGQNNKSVPAGEFSSKTFPRSGNYTSFSELPTADGSKPRVGMGDSPSKSLSAPGPSNKIPSGNTNPSPVNSNAPASGQARPAVNSGPPANQPPQPSNQYTVSQHQPGVGAAGVAGQHGVPKPVLRNDQPHSLPLEQPRPKTAGGAAQEQRTEPKGSKSEIITSAGLPCGWEKSIDRRTGRVYYLDHTTKSTHWELPPDFYASRERDAAMMQKRKAPEPPVTTEPGETTSSLKRSLSTPNLADLEEDKENLKPFRPVVDRSSKPAQPKRQLVDRSTKPLSKSRLEGLSPIYGSKGRNLTGLKNLGNTCYMNSVIQCLSSTNPLALYFNNGHYLKHLNSKSMNRRPEEVAKELAFLIKVLWSGQYRSVSPLDFKAAIGRFASQFAGYKQQDAHEFLMFFMDGIHEDTNKIKKRTPMIEQNNDNVPDNISALKAWKDYAKNNDSIIVDLFQGQFRSTVRCKTCGKKSVTFDVFSCLPLELTSQRACSLDDCIRAFTKPEMIGGNNSWKCTGCKAYREATKTIELWKLPPVVIVQLKRFSSDGMWHNKLQTKVDFPISELDMSSYLVGSGSDFSKYSLYSVVNHYGSFESGHYTAYCLNQKSWYCYDDTSVSSIDKGKLKTSAAYLLFYTAVDFMAYK